MLKKKSLLMLMLGLVSYANASLVTRYTFDSNYDDSGTAARTTTAVGSVSIQSGGVDGGGYLDLSGGYLDLASYAADWNLEGVTITAWVKADDPSVGGNIFAQDWLSTDNGTIQFRQTGTGLQAVSFVTTSTDGAPASADQWYFVAWVGRAFNTLGNHEIWVNGELISSTAMTWKAYSGNVYKNMGGDAQIGAWGGNEIFQGGIDDFRIYDEVLTGEQINAIMHEIPEPATLAVLGIGGVVVLIKRKRV